MMTATSIPDAVLMLLRAARAAETHAVGATRRDAFRVTRRLIAGCRLVNISAADLAAVLHVTEDTIRTRGSADGPVPAATFILFTGIAPQELQRWERIGVLPASRVDEHARPSYPASALISALINAPQHAVPDIA